VPPGEICDPLPHFTIYSIFSFFLPQQFAMVGNRKASRRMKEMLQKW